MKWTGRNPWQGGDAAGQAKLCNPFLPPGQQRRGAVIRPTPPPANCQPAIQRLGLHPLGNRRLSYSCLTNQHHQTAPTANSVIYRTENLGQGIVATNQLLRSGSCGHLAAGPAES